MGASRARRGRGAGQGEGAAAATGGQLSVLLMRVERRGARRGARLSRGAARGAAVEGRGEGRCCRRARRGARLSKGATRQAGRAPRAVVCGLVLCAAALLRAPPHCGLLDKLFLGHRRSLKSGICKHPQIFFEGLFSAPRPTTSFSPPAQRHDPTGNHVHAGLLSSAVRRSARLSRRIK